MYNPIRSVIRQATHRKSSRINILTFSVHESYQTNQSGANADFYLIEGEGLKCWDNKYRPLPENFTLLKDGKLPPDVQFDLVLSQNKFAHWHIAHEWSRRLNIPLINLEHCLPMPNVPKEYLQEYKNRKADLNLFISDFNRVAWGYKDEPHTKVITHGVDTDTFKPDTRKYIRAHPKNKTVLTVANDYMNRDWCLNFSLYKHITQGLPTTPVGATPGLSEAAKSVEDLVNYYQTSQVFLNTSSYSPIPCALLEAAACGCGIVTSQSACTPEIFTHGHDCLMSNDPVELRKYLEFLLQNPGEAAKLGANARETILKKCSLSRFVESWNNIFEDLLSETFIP